jgi:hypothetical protein
MKPSLLSCPETAELSFWIVLGAGGSNFLQFLHFHDVDALDYFLVPDITGIPFQTGRRGEQPFGVRAILSNATTAYRRARLSRPDPAARSAGAHRKEREIVL